MGRDVRPPKSFAADDRDRTALDRDVTSDAHDQTSDARDERSDARDERADSRSDDADFDLAAAADRSAAKRDRQSSATDRLRAQHDRVAAAGDRVLAARERSTLVIDGLTGAHLRAPGLAELEREVVKAHRTGRPLVLAFIDVDGLKRVNDEKGHPAGDVLLHRVVETIRSSVRNYDLIVRYGGDEFLCGISDVQLAEATKRFDITRTAFVASEAGSYSVGLAELRAGEDLDDLIARADTAMYDSRSRLTSGPNGAGKGRHR
jgi:diguanylate cyclase (GGDEF)-like protein